MYFADLGESCQIAFGPRIRAVGWLAAGHDFPQAPIDERVAAAVERLAEEGWVHVAAAGFHTCELCQKARDARNVLVPALDVLYVAPAMVGHYMRAHQYLPPAGFSAAVLACPDPETDAYCRQLKRFAADLSSEHFTMTEDDLERYIAEHRAWRAELRAQHAASANRKGFTWD